MAIRDTNCGAFFLCLDTLRPNTRCLGPQHRLAFRVIQDDSNFDSADVFVKWNCEYFPSDSHHAVLQISPTAADLLDGLALVAVRPDRSTQGLGAHKS